VAPAIPKAFVKLAGPLNLLKTGDVKLNASSAEAKPKVPTTTKLVADENLSRFKEVVAGSDLTKAGLLEHLKKQFPKEKKDVIKFSLETLAKREGKKEAEKRWVLV
jgi:hypothetical protein